MTPAPTVLILAAGQGTRMRSRTPKVLHDVCGAPMVLWPVRAALAAGAGRVLVVDAPARALQDVLPDGVELAVQPVANGTGGAVLAAIEQLDARAGTGGDAPAGARANGEHARDAGAGGEIVIVLSGDVPLLGAGQIAALADAHASSDAAATIVTAVLDDPSGYGRVVRDPSGAVLRVVETKKAGDATDEELRIDEVNAGIYAFDGDALRDALPRLSDDNAQGELYLPQALDVLRDDGHAIAAHVLANADAMLGVNDRVALAHVRKLAQRAIHRRHMLAGVEIVDPDATVIDVDVQIGADTTIEPFTTIRGRTRIGTGCTIRCSYVIDATLEDGVSVGPFAYLRPGATLREGAKVGTFVEVKNSDLGPGVKVPHLSYIGDADVGERTNLGAGTITANYDGHNKHRTKIGRRVKGGVDTSFVAPVSVGDDAWTAAGSVVTDDVPDGALAVARARQSNVERYAERREAPLHSEET
ncbi:MAG TPA: bifunctional UDP-N-acetylglucosamine diphosphorylase/glucosamine-1-phosphate N-acetyltransferase GlmU [Solirubrobacteraceae bacterium]|nr:bifunctional UDP-N-acetylglucosamine diphosphorylase/glucosamine-1-phosphate N-acetyltransferase GlmU [Solirubrobacteraceae bacterium]